MALGVTDAEQEWLCQEELRPILMGGKEAKEAGSVRQARKEATVILVNPAIEGTFTTTFEGKEQREGDDLAGIQLGLGMFGLIFHDSVNTNVQTYDNLFDRHAVLRT